MSKAEYIRHLIIADAKNLEKPELSEIVGGGGNLIALAALLGGTPSDLYYKHSLSEL